MANEYFKKEVAELEAMNIGIADLTADEIVALVKACERMAHPFSMFNAELAGFPHKLKCGTVLYRLTIGATVWLDEYAGKWWSEKTKSYFWALVYALGNARNPKAFETLTDKDIAHKAIAKYSLTIAATEDELLDAIAEMTSEKAERKTAEVLSDADYCEIVRDLEVATGIAADEWVWNKSADWVVRAFNRHQNIIKQSAGEHTSRMKDELDHATNCLANIRINIVNRVKAEKEG